MQSDRRIYAHAQVHVDARFMEGHAQVNSHTYTTTHSFATFSFCSGAVFSHNVPLPSLYTVQLC